MGKKPKQQQGPAAETVNQNNKLRWSISQESRPHDFQKLVTISQGGGGRPTNIELNRFRNTIMIKSRPLPQ